MDILVKSFGFLIAFVWSVTAHAVLPVNSFAPIVERVKQSVVSVAITGDTTRIGSGFIVDEQGYILTNHHVVEKGEHIKIMLSDETELKAFLVGKDEKTDIALLKVKSNHLLTPVRWENSDKAHVGDSVLVYGNPYGLGMAVSAGIISASNRDLQSSPYDDFFQTDAAINQGNSGGPLFNADGRVIGMTTAIFTPDGKKSVGINFAIPSNTLLWIYDELKANGIVRRGRLGASVVANGTATGALVTDIEKGGPAMQSELQTGDVIVMLDNQPIKVMRDLAKIVSRIPPHKTVLMKVIRAGNEHAFLITIGEMGDSPVKDKKDAN